MDRTSPLRLKVILGQTFGLWKSNWLKLTGITAIFLVIPVFGLILSSIGMEFYGNIALTGVQEPAQGLFALLAILQLALLPIAWVAVGYAQATINRFIFVKLTSVDDLKEPLPKTESLRLKCPVASLLFMFIMVLMVAVGFLIVSTFSTLVNLIDDAWVIYTGVGLVLLGLLWALLFINMRWLFVIPAIAIEGKGVLDAFRTSWRMTRGHALKITEWWGSSNTIFIIATYAFAILVYFTFLNARLPEPPATRLIAGIIASFILTIIILIMDTFRFTFASVLYFAYCKREINVQ